MKKVKVTEGEKREEGRSRTENEDKQTMRGRRKEETKEGERW